MSKYNTSLTYRHDTPPTIRKYTERTLLLDKARVTVRRSQYCLSDQNGASVIEQSIEAERTFYHLRPLFFLIIGAFIALFLFLALERLAQSRQTDNAPAPANQEYTDADAGKALSALSAAACEIYGQIQAQAQNRIPSAESLESNAEILAYISEYVPLKAGMLFSESSFLEITDEQLSALQSEYDPKVFAMLIRMGVNEVYARYGYIFTQSPWDTYYTQFEWYNPAPQNHIDFTWFNKTELFNLNKLLAIEKSLE